VEFLEQLEMLEENNIGKILKNLNYKIKLNKFKLGKHELQVLEDN